MADAWRRSLMANLVRTVFALFLTASPGELLADGDLHFASGSWFNPARNYEGLVVQVLPDGRAVVTWFTYPPEGEEGDQAWMIGIGEVHGSQIFIDEMLRPVGATFGPEFDPDSVTYLPWGTLELTFTDCNTATGAYAGPPEFGNGVLTLQRLSQIDDVECDAEAVPAPDRVIAGRSGLWYDPSHDGEGWMVEVLADGTGLVYWFTYDDAGRQAWLIGEAEIRGRTLWIEDMLIARGTRFGAAFDSQEVVLESWGEFGFLFEDCSNARMRYESPDARFGAGTLGPIRLAFLDATSCAEPPPVAPLVNGTWRLSSPMDSPVSESASATIDGIVYTAGGFNHENRVQKFDPQTETWQALPDLPADRHHPMMTTDGSRLYYAGGFLPEPPGFGGVVQKTFWRLDPDGAGWEVLPDMLLVRAAGAAVYFNGKIWIVGGAGSGFDMQVYDIDANQWSLMPGTSLGARDHTQAVVFENEIWWIGGRRPTGTSRTVMIWNPVTREWREGPPLNFARSGFAASVVHGQIMVTGGEAIHTVPAQLVPGMEVFAPGAANWVAGPEPDVTIHGVTGASANGWFILTAGSNVAASTSQNRATQIYQPQ
jgi:hypothetical protein